MKNFFSLCVAVGLFSLASCTNEKLSDIFPDKELSKSLIISLDGIQPRASEPGHAIGKDSIGVVNNLHIYITGEDGTIYACQSISEEEDWRKLAVQGKSYLFPNLDSRANNVVIFGNPTGDIRTTGSLHDLSAEVLWAQQQEVGKLLYVGQNDSWENMGNMEYGGEILTSYKATVQLKPLVARFQINTVNFQFQKDTEGIWERYEPLLAGVYMNRFYTSTQPGNILTLDYTPFDLKKNITCADRIKAGKWLFGTDQEEDFAEFAGYNKWNGSKYTALKSSEEHPDESLRLSKYSDECYAFYFFPGAEYPTLHFHVEVEEGKYSDWSAQGEVSLSKGSYFANLVKYAHTDGTLLEPEDFIPGKLYNLDIIIRPSLLTEDITNGKGGYLEVTVKVSEWDWEDLYPGGFMD